MTMNLPHLSKRGAVGIAIVALAVVVLVACGGGSQSSNTPAQNSPEVINGITVPPEPASTSNNATLAGIDSNNNGVRDDVERALAKKFGGTADFPYALAYAKSYQQIVAGPAPSDRNQALSQISIQVCGLKNAGAVIRGFGMDDLVANTPTRKQSLQIFNNILVGYIHRELPPCAP